MANFKWLQGLVLGLGMASTSLLVGCLGGDKQSYADVNQEQVLHMLSVDGVGPINANTPFNLKMLNEAFQGLNVTQETRFAEGDPYQMITVRQRAKLLLSINADHDQTGIFSVVVEDNAIGNRLGHRIGTKFVDIYTFGQMQECAPGAEEWSGKVLCYAPDTGNILYLFEGAWDGPDGKLPPMDVLADWTMAAMVWKPPVSK